MAKVMISFPDELLARLDAHARTTGRSRSGLLQELAERELATGRDARAEAVRALLAQARSFPGPSAAELVREQRRRDDHSA